ncbi:MAG TPA: hypothetical protein PLR65_04375 [Anaerolineales bacterium]|nr:hypothetical protein [Anaerolineales bacterium]
MTPKSKQELINQILNGLSGLEELDSKTRQDLLESEGWIIETLYDPIPELMDRLKDYFDWSNGKHQEDAGQLLEEIAYLLFKSLKGTGNIRSYQSYAAQHDLIVDGASLMWQVLMIYLHLGREGRTIVIECKNQESSISDQQFSRLCGLLQNKFEKTSELGVFISHTPASGFPKKKTKERQLKDARATQALFHAKSNKFVVVIDHKDLELISNGFPLPKILEAKIREIEASTLMELSFNENWQEVILPPHLKKYADEN